MAKRKGCFDTRHLTKSSQAPNVDKALSLDANVYALFNDGTVLDYEAPLL